MNRKKESEKIKFILLCILGAILVIYLLNFLVLQHKYDSLAPEIVFEQEILEVPISVTKEELLSDVKAMDKEDGEVTDTIIIESMSKLLDGNQRIVSYAAFDSDNKVGKAERRIKYTDYTSPRFYLSEPLTGNALSGDLTELLKPLHAKDCIDGDISEQIIVVDTEFKTMSLEMIEGVYKVQVTNSCGDMISLELPVKMNLTEENNVDNAKIILSEYLTYCNLGEVFDPNRYVMSVVVNGQQYGIENLTIESNVDSNTAGVYTVKYGLNIDEISTSVDLIVVVEE